MDFELEEAQWSAALPNALPGRLYLLEPGALAVQGLACASFPLLPLLPLRVFHSSLTKCA